MTTAPWLPTTWVTIQPYDYYEINGKASPGELAEALHQDVLDNMPYALVCPAGQIPLKEPDENTDNYGMPPLIPGGKLRIISELARSEESQVFILDWHT